MTISYGARFADAFCPKRGSVFSLSGCNSNAMSCWRTLKKRSGSVQAVIRNFMLAMIVVELWYVAVSISEGLGQIAGSCG